METIEYIHCPRVIPKSSEIEFYWEKNVLPGKTITKGSKIGKFNFKNSLQKFDLISKLSGKITFL
jgi:hypothetical protein